MAENKLADDGSWPTEEIAKLYSQAAKLANYSDSDLDIVRKNMPRQAMLKNLAGLRTHGWIRDIEPFTASNTLKIQFCSLAELALKLTIMGASL